MVAVGVRLNLASAVYRAGQLDEAIEQFQEAIEHERSLAEGRSFADLIRHNERVLQEAIAEHKQCVRFKNYRDVALIEFMHGF